MNQRDQELLDKQLWGVSRSPPKHSGGILCLAFVTVSASPSAACLLRKAIK
jgi:hypothetical protein